MISKQSIAASFPALAGPALHSFLQLVRDEALLWVRCCPPPHASGVTLMRKGHFRPFSCNCLCNKGTFVCT